MVVVMLFALLLAPCLAAAPQQRSCIDTDYYFAYTECNAEGSRWRVAVPHVPGVCTGLPEPVQGTHCSFSCEAGEFLDMRKQKCKKCSAGSYSLGDGVRFNEWNSLPPGFATMTFKSLFGEDLLDDTFNCSSSRWTPWQHVVASNVDECTASLVYSVDLKKPGRVSFEYQYTDASIFFEFFVQNDQCQAVTSETGSRWLPQTPNGEWKTRNVELQAGNNVLYWRSTGFMLKGRPKPVLIRSIWISGVAYTSQCFPCLAGTYSKEGFSTCSPCPRNTYSLKGASSCSKCNDVTEYSEPGSAECKLRPACTDEDYFEVHTTCDHDGMTQLTYRWVKPKFCLENLEGAVTLPASGEKQHCPPCNPGFFKNNDSVCIPCSKDSFSDGMSECQQCPAGTEPIHGYEFKWWNTLPDVMQMTCFNIHTNHCRSVDDGWNLADDNIFTSVGSADDDYLILSLEVPGFSVPELDYLEGQVVGTITFVFETICSEDCDFFFMLDIGKQVSKLVQTWHGSNEKQSFKYSLSTNATTIFSWAFQRSSPTNDTRKHISDVAKIFFINVTNVLDGVASYCKSCALDVDTRSCVPCPSGHYIESSSRFCLPCPSGTHLTNRHAAGIVACQPCGLGTKSSADHSTCFSDCSYAQEHFSFNYIELAGLHTKLIGPNFTPWGKKYFHSFNFSICGQQGNTLASCVDNITLLSTDSGSEGISRGLICRSNVILSDLHSVTLSSQAIILADWLVGVSTNNTLKKGMVAPSEIFSSSSFPHIPDVIHFYRSSDATPSCQNGRTTTIRLRCAPARPIDGEFIAPRQCHDGTCDGCTFHFLWLTPAACPLCTQDDVNIIEEACRGGVQKIQHIWKQPHICHRGLGLPEDIKRHCQTISWWMRIGILVGTFLGCLLISLTFYFWKRNRKLEYKYSRLVQNSSGKENEIPTADSCAIMEGEEEEVFFSHRKKSPFYKLASKKLNYESDADEREAFGKSMD